MAKGLFHILCIIGVFVSCARHNHVKTLSDHQITQWYLQSKWNKIGVSPQPGFNKREFVEQNLMNPAAWNAALCFLERNDMNVLDQGRVSLDAGVFATVTDYITKDSAEFEAHKKYIDIQYVSRGAENIYVTEMDDAAEYTKEYNADNDIMFFNKHEYINVRADPGCFVVLFPSDGHKPCMKIESPDLVRKIVVKIPYKE